VKLVLLFDMLVIGVLVGWEIISITADDFRFVGIDVVTVTTPLSATAVADNLLLNLLVRLGKTLAICLTASAIFIF